MSPADPQSEATAASAGGKNNFIYPGRELEAMAEAANYYRWILRIFRPYLGRHIVEVGAGLGSFSELILGHHQCETLSLVEPSVEMHQRLVTRVPFLNRNKNRSLVKTYGSSFAAAAPLIKAEQVPDTILYVNVLEHIANDELELQSVHETLSASGRVLLFVPALPWLYGAFDARVGHVRRYTKTGLEEKLRRAGFKTALLSYFDMVGIAPWWIKYCLLRSATMGPGGVRFYDRFVVPAMSRIESLLPMPLGKNLIAVAEKSNEY
jgi:SAM-dependent methyltransferase